MLSAHLPLPRDGPCEPPQGWARRSLLGTFCFLVTASNNLLESSVTHIHCGERSSGEHGGNNGPYPGIQSRLLTVESVPTWTHQIPVPGMSRPPAQGPVLAWTPGVTDQVLSPKPSFPWLCPGPAVKI